MPRLLQAGVSSIRHRCVGVRPHSTASPSVDEGELRRFGDLSSEWSDENGPFKALHSLNTIRVPWILQNLKKAGSPKRIVDIGSGGGILSVPLARSSTDISVVGIDATPEAVNAASTSLQSPSITRSGISSRVSFVLSTAEDYAKSNAEGFDAVVASEIAEHVADLSSFVAACATLARPGAPIFFTTMNRTLLSKVAAVWLAEDVLHLVPKGVHDWDKFITPDELTQLLEDNGCRVRSINGFTYHPIANRWDWCSTQMVNYALMAQKI